MARALSLLAIAALLLGSCAPGTSAAPSPSPAPPSASASAIAASPTTPASPEAACRAPAQPTTASTEGPFYKAGSPERASLVEPGIAGTRLVLSGRVLTRSCAAVAGAIPDFWQADASGAYDNTGYRLRGNVRSDAAGAYRVETIVPAEYPGRTPHIHVKVTPPGRAVLTTQLYLPGLARNSSDSIFRPELVVRIESAGPPVAARFDFVLDVP
jgi:protocatechuate 3,4-dioxygenase beta subunit